jgi:roadblock/LC7 domain-containing protein
MELTVQDNSIFVQKFNANGTISGDMVRLEAISKTDGSDHYPQITAVGTAGEYVVTFYGREREGGHSIFVQKFNANGTISGDMVQLEALGNTTSNDHAPQITAVGTAGEYVVTFTGADSAGDDSIFVQKFNANGTISGDMVPLEAISKTDGDDGISQITAVGTAGEYVVTFTGEDGAGDESIFVQKFNANGTISGSMVRLEALGRTIGDDFSPQITAVGTAGEYVVTFSGYDSAGDYSIFVQKFNADGTVASANSPLAVDTVAPTVAITSDVETLKANETATITFTFSEVPTGFVQADDVVVTGGTLGAITFDSTGKIGTATYTPTADTASATASITIASSLFTDAAGNAAGNAGGAGTTPTIAIDTLAPTVAIASSSSTRDTTPIIEGNAEAGATVTVVVSGATYEVIATQNGIWSLNLESATPKSGALTPLQVGQNYTVTVNAIDVAGNSAEGQTQTLNVVANQIPYIRNLDWIDTDGQNGSDTPVMYIAKGQEVNINLQNYIKDSDGDDVTVTVNSSTLPAGFSINNGIITGTTTADSGNINVTLSDGNGGIKTQTIALQSIVIPDNFAKTYSQTTPQIDPIDPTTTFFGVSSGGKDIWQAIINKTEVSQQEYNYNGSLFVVDSEDQETFIVSNVIDNGVIISVGGTTESIVLSEAKEVTSINSINTTGLKQVTATFTVLTSTPIESTSTDNWFVIPDDELHQSVSLSMLTELKNMLLDSNYDRYIYK